jgi:hypothetical protein
MSLVMTVETRLRSRNIEMMNRNELGVLTPRVRERSTDVSRCQSAHTLPSGVARVLRNVPLSKELASTRISFFQVGVKGQRRNMRRLGPLSPHQTR